MEKHFHKPWSRPLLLTLLSLLMAVGGSSPAWAQKALPYSYGFEETFCSTSGWTEVSCHSSSENYNVGSSGVHEGAYAYRFYYSTNPPHQYLISPELASSSYPLSVSFWYKAHSTSYDESFKFGYSTTDTETTSFTWEEEVKTNSTTWTEYTTTCPAGTKYICIAYTANDTYYLYIDDLNIEDLSPYVTPKAFAATSVTATNATFSWTNGKDETAWQIAYSTTEGFDADAATKVDVTTNPYTLEGLTAETTYYARIRADYGSGNYSNWSDEVSFKPTNAISTTVNDGTTTNNYVPFHGNYADTQGTMSQFIIPASSLTALQGRQITDMTFYANYATKDFGNARFDVYMTETTATTFDAATFDWSNMEKVAASATVNVTDGKMTITFDDAFDYGDGNLMIGFNIVATGGYVTIPWYGIAATNAAIGSYTSYGSANASIQSFLPKVTFTSLPNTASVKKPRNLTVSATATTTATLGWTDGEEGLSAWQIAYATDADFDPETAETKVDADANPFTLTELTAATTYYAYVRAKKGDEYSAWSNKVEFTTLAAVPVIKLSATSHNFGMVTDADAQALTLTISNTGGADLTGLTVTASAGFAVTDAEGNALTATTIAASSSLTVKVKISAVGQQSGAITISGDDIEDLTVNVSGYMLDNTKIAETFATAAPAHWTEYAYKAGYSTYNWTYSADGAYNTNENSTLSTPKLTIAEGEALTIYAKLKSSATYGYLMVEGSNDNGESWTAYSKKLDYEEAFGSTTNVFQVITLSDIPTTVNKLRFKSYYAYLNAVNGFTYAADPVLALYSDEECTTDQATPAAKNFGFITEAQAQTYYIKNTGTGQIDLEANEVSGFSVTITDAALIEGESTAVAISMAATEGLHDATLTVTAKNHDTGDVLGTFEVALNGAVAGSQNDVNFASLSELPAGWETTNWTVTANSYVGVGSTAGDLTTQTLTVGNGDVLLVEAKGSSSWSEPTLSYSYKAGDADWTEAQAISGVAYSDWKIFAITGIPAGDVKVKFNGQYTNIRRIYGFTAKVEPYMVFAEAGTTKNFGMTAAAATSDAYTITNSGTADIQNLSVTCDNANFTISVAESATTVAANGGTATFTVTLKNTANGQQTGTVTISGDGVETKTFTVKGYVCDSEQLFETMTTALPEGWDNTSWSISNEAAYATSSSSQLVSPKLKIAAGQKLAISAKQRYSGSSYYVKVEGYDTANSDWTYSKTLSSDVLNNTDYTVVEIADIPATVNRIRLVGYYAYVNAIAGFTYDQNDPKFAMYSDSECTSKINETTATNAWDFVTEDKTATYYIKNDGTGTMTLAATEAPAGFTAVLDKTSLTAGESTTLTISMSADDTANEGYHAGTVTLTATDSEANVLGTFAVTSSGVVVSTAKTDIDFTSLTAFPAGWETTNWSVSSGKATVSYTSGDLTTGTYTVANGETMVVKAKKQYSSGSLSYSYSTDGGTTWSDAQDITPASTSYELKAVSGIPAGQVKLKFSGVYADIERIYGFTAVLEPAMALTPDATSYDFGMQTAAADYVITVANNGTAPMNGLTATLGKTGDAAEYTAVVSSQTVAVGETATITVTQLYDAAKGLASLSDVLTISADGISGKTIALSGQTRDASKLYVDFEDATIPASFAQAGNWSASSKYAANNNSTESSLITKPITLAAGEKLQFSAKNPYSGSLKVRYSIDGGISWSDYTDYTEKLNSSTFTSLDIDLQNTEEVTAVIDFCGRYYVQLDNIYGGTLKADAPMIAVTKDGAAVVSGTSENFGQILTEASATYTVANIGAGTLAVSAAKTGDATVSINKTSLAAGESATLTITMPVADSYGEKSGTVTLETSLGNFVINYTATILNPNALNVDFADNALPAGWYMGGNWSISGQQATQESSTATDLITEQLSVSGESDALTFQAARVSSYSTPTMTVAYSQDRLNWTTVDLGDLTLTTAYQDVTVSGLAAGNYYLKISGSRIKVDNFLGWTKKNNTRDLYVTATSFPTAAQTAGATISASATVTSLIAAEEGVYAKLFIDDEAVKILNSDNEEIEQTAAASVAKDGSTIFTVRYVLPNVNGTYTAQIKFYYSDASEAFATATSDITVDYPSLALYEMEDPTLSAGTYNVTLDHDFVAGWNTVCLPFEITASQIADGAKAYAFDSYNATTHVLNFTQATTLEAGKPYVVYTPEAITSDLQFSGVTIAEENVTAGNVESNGATFQGTYAKKAAGSMTGMYGVTSAAKIAKGTANAYMRGFRAYFSLPANAPAPRMMFDGEIVTGISAIEMAAEEGERIYNVNGQRVMNPKKGGMYIVGGKKVVVK